MPAPILRLIFGALCVAGMFAILAGLLFEWGRLRRGNSVLSPRQMRWRIVGGTLWILVLGSFAYATAFLWPSDLHDVVTGRRFVSVMAGAAMLLVVALIITAFDAFLTLKGAQFQRQKFERNAGEAARAEIERIRAQHGGNSSHADGVEGEKP